MRKRAPPEQDHIKNTRLETIEWAKANGIKIVRTVGKDPIDLQWNSPEVYEASQADWEKWFISEQGNIGFICGKASENLVIIDCDSKETFEAFKRFLGDTTTVRTGSGKWHIYLRTLMPIHTFRRHEGKIQFDIQSEGVQGIAPMSIHPDTKKPYAFLSKVPPKVWEGDLELDIKQILFEKFGVKYDDFKKVNISELLQGVEEGNRDCAAIRVATYYRTQGKNEEETLTLLEDWNKRNKPSLEHKVLQVKVRSAFKDQTPYHFDFEETEIFTEEEQKEVEHLLANPEQILHYVFRANQDVVQEDKNKILIPILELAKLSMEVSGKSAGGKNHLVDCVMLCFPKKWIKKITGATDKAFRYLGDEYRTVYLAERRGMESPSQESTTEYDMKVGISEGEIVTLYPHRDPESGKMVLDEKRVKVGNFIMTTTEIAPPPELENRIFNLVVDESVEQNVRVRDFQLEEATKPPSKRVNVQHEKKILRCLFEKLDKELTTAPIIIPYAHALKKLLPTFDTSIRRHTLKLLNIIACISRVFAKKLPKYHDGSDECIIATPNVFWYVWQIGDEAIFTQIIGLTERQLFVWDVLKNLFISKPEVSTKELAEAARFATGTAEGYFKEFEIKGLIFLRKEGRENLASPGLDIRETVDFANVELSFSELKTQFENNLRKIGVQKVERDIPLMSPFTGEKVLEDAHIIFKPKKAVMKTKKKKEKTQKVNASDKGLGEFSNAVES